MHTKEWIPRSRLGTFMGTKINGSIHDLDLKKLTIVMMDIKGSSAMWLKNPVEMYFGLDQLFDTVKGLTKKYNGTIVKTIGDAFMITFEEIERAVQFACNMQYTMARQPIHVGGTEVIFRIGIFEGDVFEKHMDIQHCHMSDFFGNTVNTAARLESRVSDPGHFAIGSDYQSSESLMNLILENIPDCSLKTINFTNKIQALTGITRSARLVPYSFATETRPSENLNGVAPIVAVQVTLSGRKTF